MLVKRSIAVKKLFNHSVTESQKTLDIGQCKNKCSRDLSDTRQKVHAGEFTIPILWRALLV